MAHTNISTKQTQRERTDLWLPRGKGCVGGKDGELRIRRCKLIHRTDKQQGPTV